MKSRFLVVACTLAAVSISGCLSPSSLDPNSSAGSNAINSKTLSSKIAASTLDEELKAELSALITRLEADPNYQITSEDLDLLKESALLEDGDLAALGT
ncbi:MAG TPA: hypothetical protein PLH57_02410 [Oligoflexia bacterium]|nr:hypothetical protein [Oligoflexia bacterium]